MTHNALYADLSAHYDLLCADIDYGAQADAVHRLHQLLGNGGNHYLDLACGTGAHLQHFVKRGYRAWGLDLNQPMLAQAQARCPEAEFLCDDMAGFCAPLQVDLISCFLYSIHYNNDIARLQQCLTKVHQSLRTGGLFCFNAVDCRTIADSRDTSHCAIQDGSSYRFSSGWRYSGVGERQWLTLRIEKTRDGETRTWTDQHPMVAITFSQLHALLTPLFDVQILAHDYHTIAPWDGQAGNALFACVKK